jgi:hypothetical protein
VLARRLGWVALADTIATVTLCNPCWREAYAGTEQAFVIQPGLTHLGRSVFNCPCRQQPRNGPGRALHGAMCYL